MLRNGFMRQPLFVPLGILCLGGIILWGLQKATGDISFDAVVLRCARPGRRRCWRRSGRRPSATLRCSVTIFPGCVTPAPDCPCASFFSPRFAAMRSAMRLASALFRGARSATGFIQPPASRPARLLELSASSPPPLASVSPSSRGSALILRANEVSRMLGTSPEPLIAAAATILALASVFLMFCAMRRRPLVLGAVVIEPPGAGAGSDADRADDDRRARRRRRCCGHCCRRPGIGFLAFAAVYAAALGLGVLSHVPGGLGVFEVAILYAVGSKAPVSAVWPPPW